MIRPIVKFGGDTLHRPAEVVQTITADIATLARDMIETMYAAPGIGLAAPQIGVPIRLFVIDLSLGHNPKELITLVNPEFVERDGMQLEEEGCLSLPGFNATVARPERATIRGPRLRGARAFLLGRRPAGTRVPARNGPPRWPGVRRSPSRNQAKPDPPPHPEADAQGRLVVA